MILCYYVILSLYYYDIIYHKWDFSLYFSTTSAFSIWDMIYYYSQEKTDVHKHSE